MNQIPTEEFQLWQLNGAHSRKGKSFAPLGLRKGQDFTEYDLMYENNGMLFWGPEMLTAVVLKNRKAARRICRF